MAKQGGSLAPHRDEAIAGPFRSGVYCALSLARFFLKQQRFLFCLVILTGLSLSLSGCTASRQVVVAAKPPLGAEGVVFAADGAGDFRVSSNTLRKVVQEDGVPLHVVPVLWSHGYGRIIADQVNRTNVRAQGKKLADQVEEFHRDFPETPIYLWGHSAGSGVILAALENLPPGIVERALLLSPSVPSCYDVRLALGNVKQGLHVFYSYHDWVYLGVATCLLDKAQCTATSGRIGFRHLGNSEEDQILYGKLWQRPWKNHDQLTGNLGGHYGNYAPGFLRLHLLPLLRPSQYWPSTSQNPVPHVVTN
jgi:pimeloyl-ACP methyl ester carboxylesterase